MTESGFDRQDRDTARFDVEVSAEFHPGGPDPQPPSFSLERAQALARERFGIAGSLCLLSGERDQTFRLLAQNGKAYVLKIANENEDHAALALQSAALLEIESRDPGLPVPRVCRSLSGNIIEVVELGAHRHSVRVLTFLRGEPVARFGTTPALRRLLGMTLARLDHALANFSHPASSPSILWDVARAHRLRPLLASVEDPALLRLLEPIFEAAASRVRMHLASLRTQVIHNDFNANNVLVQPDRTAEIAGIIDFGDMLKAPLVVDLAVSVARQVSMADAIDEACDIAEGYHAVFPLHPAEVEVLYDLACSRLAMRLVVWTWRSKVSFVRFNSTEFEATRRVLETFVAAGRQQVTARFLSACRPPYPV